MYDATPHLGCLRTISIFWPMLSIFILYSFYKGVKIFKFSANLLTLVNKFFAKDTALMKKMEKHVDSCIAMSARHKDECDLAAKLNACTNNLMAHNKHKLTVNY